MDQGLRHPQIGALDTLSKRNFAPWRQVYTIPTRLSSRVDGSRGWISQGDHHFSVRQTCAKLMYGIYILTYMGNMDLILTSWILKESPHIQSLNPKIILCTFHGPGVILGFRMFCVTFFVNGPLARYAKLRVRMRRECRERFPRHCRQVIPTCITARAWRTCRDACRGR